MTQEEILEYNKLCAEFLGYEISENKKCFKLPNKNGWIILDVFHSDWNFIMEVVGAIEKQKYLFRINTSPTVSEKWTSHIIIIQKYSQVFNGKAIIEYKSDYNNNETKKEAVVQAINQFLIYYNKNNK